MKKPRVVIPDWLVGGVVSVLLIIAFLVSWGPLESIEMKLYDLRARLRETPQVGPEVAIVAIDEDSIDQLGRWPWPRIQIAKAIDTVSEAGAKVIGLTILYTDYEQSQGLKEIRELRQSLRGPEAEAAAGGQPGAPGAPPVAAPPAKKPAAPLDPRVAAAQAAFIQALLGVEKRLDNDDALAGSLELSGNVVLPLYFEVGTPLGRPEGELPPEILKNFVTEIDNPNDKAAAQVIETVSMKPPIPPFAKAAKVLGHLNLVPERDGVYRQHLMLLDYQGQYFPSFATQLVATYLNLQPKDIHVRLGGGMRLGHAEVPTDAAFRMMVNYNGGYRTFPYYSIADLLSGKLQPEALRNAFQGKIVIIGITHVAMQGDVPTPVDPRMPQPEVVANVVENILHQKFITRPAWAGKLELALLVLFGAFISLVLPRLGAGKSAAVAGILLVVFFGAGIYLFVAKGYWIKLLYPTLVLGVGYAAIISKKYLITEQRKEVLEVESAETNKMLGLSFQGQGMLDLAFEKFRRCPVEDVKEELYNLGLDFERKRQFTKAASVYQQIAAKLPKFKDIESRIPKLVAAGETIIAGTAGLKRGGAESTVLVEGADLKPTLGRYEIIRELGKGAMGTVFLGKDPKINRMVAIKTLRFEDDLDPEDEKALKERFFREAESAGKLSHPNIVTIFDTGEDQDMCYIAMELLDGRDLKDWTAKEQLFPMKTAVEHIATVADALTYAHEQSIVHRDIKPANIMLLKNGVIKVTDFGIARITTSSRTATGTVMGTPSYMSPEQLAGKKVDGRSDLFSLGVTLYELLTGEKPFAGESIATLMFKIANERHETPRQYNPNIPDAVIAVIDRALAKAPEERYQKGKEMATDLRAALAEMERSAAAPV
jgi:serine/threonine-protein kinase